MWVTGAAHHAFTILRGDLRSRRRARRLRAVVEPDRREIARGIWSQLPRRISPKRPRRKLPARSRVLQECVSHFRVDGGIDAAARRDRDRFFREPCATVSFRKDDAGTIARDEITAGGSDQFGECVRTSVTRASRNQKLI